MSRGTTSTPSPSLYLPTHLSPPFSLQAVEDRLNAAADSEFGVQSIILVEDNVKFYSTYMPLLHALNPTTTRLCPTCPCSPLQPLSSLQPLNIP